MNIEHYNSPNTMSRCGWVPDIIACHITDGGFDGAVAWLCNPASGVSANFSIARSGRIAQLVDIRQAAFCNGTQSGNPLGARYVGRATAVLVKQRRVNANLYTISIELEGDENTHGILTEAQFASLVWLVQYIRQQVKILYGVTISFDRNHIIGHCEITPREKPDCPGRDFPYNRLIATVNPANPITWIDTKPGAYNGDIVIEGWAVAASGVKSVGIYADNNRPLKGIGTLNERPDVQRIINPNGRYTDAVHSGYSYTIPRGTLAPGKHTVRIGAAPRDGGSACWASVDITVV